MKKTLLAHFCFYLNLVFGLIFVPLHFFRGGIHEGVVSLLVAIWLVLSPWAYIRDLPLPLFGDFSFKSGANQTYRRWGVALTVFISAALFFAEIRDVLHWR